MKKIAVIIKENSLYFRTYPKIRISIHIKNDCRFEKSCRTWRKGI